MLTSAVVRSYASAVRLARRRALVFDAGMRIGVISDTHGLLRPEAEARLAGVDHIIHAGDIGGPDLVPRLRAMAPTTAIRGNIDTQPWARVFPERITVALAGRAIHVLHDIGALDSDPAERGVAVVISGHSHRPSLATVAGVLFVNPGGAGPRRFNLPVTLAAIELGRAVRLELHNLLAGTAAAWEP